MSRNMLADETSPYLLQHADNPVHWYPWGEDALARAKAEGKPILLSVGYAACHWCHVMAHESFEDEETAAVMNELYVNIKVDREERPDLDAIYQAALALMGEQGGWPLTMFLTPEGEPFWGGTYFPPRAGYGRPGFPDLLVHIDRIYRTEGDKVAQNTRAIVGAIAEMSAAKPGDPPSPADVAAVTGALAGEIDREHGGFGTAPKFPQCAILRTMWAHGDAGVRDAVALTLDCMAQGGIYDHLGGGFARYSTDPVWLAPHFEKMLYDNAQFVELYTIAWRATQNPFHAERVAETVGWLLREMNHPDGGFYSTLDADSEGVEGKFYVWDAAEIDSVLGDDAAWFKDAYDVRLGGNWDEVTILNRTRSPARRSDADEARLAEMRVKLFAAREPRVRPGLDDKILADWNGLMIAALAEAAMTFEAPEWLDAAVRAYAFVRDRLAAEQPGGSIELLHSWREGKANNRATLDDYAALARAALALHEATLANMGEGGTGYLADAKALVACMEAHFSDGPGAGGAYYFTSDLADDVIVRTRNGYDNATPSGNGMAALALARLWLHTGEDAYRARAEDIVRFFAGEIRTNAFSFASLMDASVFLAGATQVAVVGDPADPATRALHAAAFRGAATDRVVQVVAPGAALPDGHPATGKGTVEGAPAAYVCRGPVCALPITDPDALVAELSA
jgi:uncharacterized protein YyaL (SSP411 family)